MEGESAPAGRGCAAGLPAQNRAKNNKSAYGLSTEFPQLHHTLIVIVPASQRNVKPSAPADSATFFAAFRLKTQQIGQDRQRNRKEERTPPAHRKPAVPVKIGSEGIEFLMF